jgi:DNA-binding beta-propeller fold protein YncE
MNVRMRVAAAALLGWAGLLGAPACGGDAEPSATADDAPSTTTAAVGLSVEGTEEAAFATQFATLAAGDAWMPNPDDGQVTRVDGGTGEVVAEIPVGDPDAPGFNPDPQSVTTDPDGQVWAGIFSTDSADRIDPETNEVVESVPLGIDPYGLVVTGTDIWATDFEEGLIVRVDRATGTEVARIEELTSPTAILHAYDAIWVAHHRSGRVIRIDPATNTVNGSSETRGTVEGMIAFGDAVWVAWNSGRALLRIEPDELEVAILPLGANG